MEPVIVTDGADRFTANAYLVDGDTTVLVDCGTPPWVVDRLAERVDRLDEVYLTHTHHDHIEQLDAVTDRFDPEVHAFAPHPGRTHAIEDGDELPLGETTVTALHTPGHAEDHVVFYDDARLFSGDVVVYNDEAFDDGSFGRTDISGGDREVLIDSVERLRSVLPSSVDTMYPGHGGVYAGDVHAVIERALERASRREPKYPDE